MNYTVKALIIYLFAMIVTIAVNEFTSIAFNALHISLLGLFMYGTSVLVHRSTVKAAAKEPARFPAYFMAITGLKMLAYILVLGIYVFVYKETGIPVVITFLILYVAYTILEVTSVLSELKN